MITIPLFTPDQARWTQTIELDGVPYQLSFHYNSREDAWYMSILDFSGNNILNGIKLVSQYKLLSTYRAIVGLPPGEFWIYDTLQDNSSGAVDWDNFGTRYQLIYSSAADVATMGGS